MLKNGNGNGAGKDRRRVEALTKGLHDLSSVSEWLKGWYGADPREGFEKVTEAINIIERIKGEIAEIDGENNHCDNRQSDHHPAKKAIWGLNNFTLSLCAQCHVNLEKNILKAEAMVLRMRPRIYAEINVRFMIKEGRDLSDKEIADIVFQEEMRIRKKVSPQDFMEKLLERPIDIVSKMRDMINNRMRR